MNKESGKPHIYTHTMIVFQYCPMLCAKKRGKIQKQQMYEVNKYTKPLFWTKEIIFNFIFLVDHM